MKVGDDTEQSSGQNELDKNNSNNQDNVTNNLQSVQEPLLNNPDTSVILDTDNGCVTVQVDNNSDVTSLKDDDDNPIVLDNEVSDLTRGIYVNWLL